MHEKEMSAMQKIILDNCLHCRQSLRMSNTTTAPKDWVSMIVSKSLTSTAWALLPATATVLAARPEGTKWEISYEIAGERKSHFAGVQFTQTAAQLKACFAR